MPDVWLIFIFIVHMFPGERSREIVDEIVDTSLSQ